MGGAGLHTTSWSLSEDCGIKELCLHVRLPAGRSAEPASVLQFFPPPPAAAQPHTAQQDSGQPDVSAGVGAERALHGQQPGGGERSEAARRRDSGPTCPRTSRGIPPRPSSQAGTGSTARTTRHSASVMSETTHGVRAGRSAALPNLRARQSHDREGELDSMHAGAKDCGNRASWRLVWFAPRATKRRLLLCAGPRAIVTLRSSWRLREVVGEPIRGSVA